jgi:hypothetical protein
MAEDLTGSPHSRDRDRIRQFLDNPNARWSFLIKSGHDGTAEQQVERVVDQTAHYGFFKITIASGIEIDPRHPEEASVFTLLLKPAEIERLRDQLKAALPDLVEENPVDPRIVTQLADIGDVRAFPPAPLADVLISREDLALRTNVPGSTNNAAPAASQGVAPGIARGHTLEPIPGKSDRRSPAGAAGPARGSDAPDDKVVVLVWVCRPHAG